MKQHHVILACKDRTKADGIKLAIILWAGVGLVDIVTRLDELEKFPLGDPGQLIVIDEHLEGITSRDVLFSILKACLPSKVLVLTNSIDVVFLKKIVHLVSCVPAGNGLDEIKEAISRCLRTGGYASLNIFNIIAKAGIVITGNELLSKDLIEVLHHWVKGYKLKESAAERETVPGTIKVQRRRIKQLITPHGFKTPRDYARHIGLVND